MPRKNERKNGLFGARQSCNLRQIIELFGSQFCWEKTLLLSSLKKLVRSEMRDILVNCYSTGVLSTWFTVVLPLSCYFLTLSFGMGVVVGVVIIVVALLLNRMSYIWCRESPNRSIVDCREARRVPSICLEAGIIDNFASMLLNVYMEL